jgi:hypothetical protein
VPRGENLRKRFALLSVALGCLALVAFAAPKIEFSWRNPEYKGGSFQNILVLALNGKAANRAEFEDQLTSVISRDGAKAFPSYEFLARPDATPIDMKDFRELIREQKFDGIVVARLVKKDTKTTYVPGQTYALPYPYYSTFYGYYQAVYPVVYTPGYMETEKTAQVEINFYSALKPDGELVWTGTTNNFDRTQVMKQIKNLAKVVGKEFEKQSIIPAK